MEGMFVNLEFFKKKKLSMCPDSKDCEVNVYTNLGGEKWLPIQENPSRPPRVNALSMKDFFRIF